MGEEHIGSSPAFCKWRMNMKKAIMAAFASILIMQCLITVPVGIAEAVGEEEDILSHKIITGKTEAFGGGDYILVNMNETMTFGIIHGSKDHNAPITIFTKGLDVLGAFRGKNGTFPLTSNIFTIYRFTYLMEFNDTNNNDRYDPGRSFNSEMGADRPIKRLNLSLNWQRSELRKRNTSSGFEWGLSLYASNVSYTRDVQKTADRITTVSKDEADDQPTTVSKDEADDQPTTVSKDEADDQPTTVSKDEVLELIKFDIRISVTRGRSSITFHTYELNSVRDKFDLVIRERKIEDLRSARVNWKVDHRILGWDFSPVNDNPKLMLGFDLTFARSYNSIAALRADIISTIGDDGSKVSIPIKGAESSIWIEDVNSPTRVEESGLDAGDISMGTSSVKSRFFWKRELDRLPSTISRQIDTKLFLYEYELIGPASDIWENSILRGNSGVGIRIKGGYTYPALRMIVHDPGIEALGFRPPVFREVSDPGWGETVINAIQGNTTITIFFTLVVILIAIATAAILTLSRKGNMYHDQELKFEQEEELFAVSRRKKDWDSLRIK